MTSEDELLLEQKFPYINMTKEERDLCINLILNSKDVSDSDIYINQHGLSKYEILFMNLTKINDFYHFNGVVYNEYENRWIDGHISKCNGISFDSIEDDSNINKEVYYMRTNVYRCNDILFGEDKEYSSEDYFYIKTVTKNNNTEQRTFRKSRYENTTYSEAEILLLDEESMNLYLEDFVRTLKLK